MIHTRFAPLTGFDSSELAIDSQQKAPDTGLA